MDITSGIHGGYRLVSTYDIPDSGSLGFGLSDNFHWGGGILGHSDLDSDNFHLGGVFWDTQIWTLTIFILGGYSGTLGFGLSDNFHLGGILGHSDLDSLTIFFGGVFWDTRIWTLTIFIWGGYSGALGFGL